MPNQENIHSHTSIRVVAPATLEEGFTFDVLLQGEPYTVTVPPGGVEQGEEFDIPYPTMMKDDDDCSSNSSRSSFREHNNNDDENSMLQEQQESNKHGDNNNNKKKNRFGLKNLAKMESMASLPNNTNSHRHHDLLGAPIGHWRYPVYACCDVLTQATFWMACFCTPVLLAQLITRLRLNWNGTVIDNTTPDDDNNNNANNQDAASLSFNRIVLSFVAVLMVGQFLPGLALIFTGLYLLVLLVWIGGNVRRTVRQRYRIPPSITMLPCNKNRNCCCYNNNNNNVNSNSNTAAAHYYARIEDGLCLCFCGSCALIQMARQTHNDKEYPGLCCTTTGLEQAAPEIPYLLIQPSSSTEASK